MTEQERETYIIEQLRQKFVAKYQDDDWHITDVRPSDDARVIEWGQRFNVVGTYVVEMTAMRDIDGYNKHGSYCKCAKDTQLLYTVWVLQGGQVHGALMQMLPVTINAANHVDGVGYDEITPWPTFL